VEVLANVAAVQFGNCQLVGLTCFIPTHTYFFEVVSGEVSEILEFFYEKYGLFFLLNFSNNNGIIH
jgi:hypothetical protein